METQFFGHVLRKEALENTVTSGKRWGRPREMTVDGLKQWHGRFSSRDVPKNHGMIYGEALSYAG